MRSADAKALFPTEAALCELFINDVREVGGWTIYPETAGFDILCVYEKTGHQLGVEAKLCLNAKVADQILPGDNMGFRDSGVAGPDFRAVIVPYIGDASEGIAKMLRILGVLVWAPESNWHRGRNSATFARSIGDHWGTRPDRRAFDTSDGSLNEWEMAWHDWNPPTRCRLPEIVPDVQAGVPAPVQLTPWKIGALRVIADLELDGFVTAKSVRDHGIDARRFCASDGWLTSIGEGRWTRGRLPAFEKQHAEAYRQVLEQARVSRQEKAA